MEYRVMKTKIELGRSVSDLVSDLLNHSMSDSMSDSVWYSVSIPVSDLVGDSLWKQFNTSTRWNIEL